MDGITLIDCTGHDSDTEFESSLSDSDPSSSSNSIKRNKASEDTLEAYTCFICGVDISFSFEWYLNSFMSN